MTRSSLASLAGAFLLGASAPALAQMNTGSSVPSSMGTPGNVPGTTTPGGMPNTGLPTVPNSNLSTVPNTGVSTAPATSLSTVPSTGVSSVPNTGINTLPPTGAAALDGTGTTTATGVPSYDVTGRYNATGMPATAYGYDTGYGTVPGLMSTGPSTLDSDVGIRNDVQGAGTGWDRNLPATTTAQPQPQSLSPQPGPSSVLTGQPPPETIP